MHIETLKVFCDLAELRSFSKTAEKHLLSQSAISQQLAQLELEHKCQLVNRKKRPIELTPHGHILYQGAKEVLERYEKLKSQLSSARSKGEERINVASIFSIGMHALPRYVKWFMVEYPNVNMHVEYASADKIYEMVLAGDVDIGLVAVPRHDKRLNVYEFKDERLVFVCNPQHPLSHEPEIDIHQIMYERFIAFDKEVPTRIWIDQILHRYNVDLQVAMEFDNVETVKRAVEIGSGVSILPEISLEQEVATGTLRAIPFSNDNFSRPTGIIVRADKPLSRASKYFIDLLTSGDKKFV